MQLALAQLQRVAVDYGESAKRNEVLAEFRREAESVRTGRAGAKGLPMLDLAQGMLRGCTMQQLVNDLAYLYSQLEAAKQVVSQGHVFGRVETVLGEGGRVVARRLDTQSWGPCMLTLIPTTTTPAAVPEMG